MTQIVRRQAFPLKDMPQMRVAPPAHNFGAYAVRIGMTPNGSFDLIIESRPPAPGIELMFRLKQWGATLFAEIHPRFKMPEIFSGTRRFGTFFQYDPPFLRGQFLSGFEFHSGFSPPFYPRLTRSPAWTTRYSADPYEQQPSSFQRPACAVQYNTPRHKVQGDRRHQTSHVRDLHAALDTSDGCRLLSVRKSATLVPHATFRVSTRTRYRVPYPRISKSGIGLSGGACRLF